MHDIVPILARHDAEQHDQGVVGRAEVGVTVNAGVTIAERFTESTPGRT